MEPFKVLFGCCLSPRAKVPPETTNSDGSAGPPPVLPHKTVQTDGSSAPRATFRQRLVRGLKSVAAAFSCGLYRVKQPRTEEQLQHDCDAVRNHTAHGDELMSQKEYPAALDAYQAALPIQKRLADQETLPLRESDNLMSLYRKIGQAESAQWAIGTIDSTKPPQRVRDDAAIDHIKRGDALLGKQIYSMALEAYREALPIQTRLVQQDPGRVVNSQNLAYLHAMIGDAQLGMGSLQAALASYEASLDIRERLVAQNPNDLGRTHTLAVELEKIGYIKSIQLADSGSARPHYQRVIELLTPLVKDHARFPALLRRCQEAVKTIDVSRDKTAC
jgi:tetratricopeptide (TPR) repeat protein